MKKHDNTVPIAIAITITILVIFGIVIGTTCKDKFANLKNIGLFSNVKTDTASPYNFADSMFNKWHAKVGQSVSIEEAKERWNKVIAGSLTGYSNLLSKPIEQLSQEEQKHRKLIEEKIPKRVITKFSEAMIQ